MTEAEKILNEHLVGECIEAGGSWECLGWEVDGVRGKMLLMVVGHWSEKDTGVLPFFSEGEMGVRGVVF